MGENSLAEMKARDNHVSFEICHFPIGKSRSLISYTCTVYALNHGNYINARLKDYKILAGHKRPHKFLSIKIREGSRHNSFGCGGSRDGA